MWLLKVHVCMEHAECLGGEFGKRQVSEGAGNRHVDREAHTRGNGYRGELAGQRRGPSAQEAYERQRGNKQDPRPFRGHRESDEEPTCDQSEDRCFAPPLSLSPERDENGIHSETHVGVLPQRGSAQGYEQTITEKRDSSDRRANERPREQQSDEKYSGKDERSAHPRGESPPDWIISEHAFGEAHEIGSERRVVRRHRVWRGSYGSRGGDGIHLVEIGKDWEILKEPVLNEKMCHDQSEGDESRGEPCAMREHIGELYVFCTESGTGKSRMWFQSRD